MTSGTRFFATLIALALLAPAQAIASENKPMKRPSYSGEGQFRNDTMMVPFRVYHDGGRERREELVGGTMSIKIMRPDLGVMYIVLPEAKMAMAMPVPPEHMTQTEEELQKYELTALGTQVIGGESATKYAVPGQPGMQTYIWLTSDGIPMRLEGNMQGQQPLLVELSSVQRGPQDVSLFEVPSDFQVMQMGPGGMQGMPGMQGGPGMQGMPGMQQMPGAQNSGQAPQMPDMTELLKQAEQMEKAQQKKDE